MLSYIILWFGVGLALVGGGILTQALLYYLGLRRMAEHGETIHAIVERVRVPDDDVGSGRSKAQHELLVTLKLHDTVTGQVVRRDVGLTEPMAEACAGDCWAMLWDRQSGTMVREQDATKTLDRLVPQCTTGGVALAMGIMIVVLASLSL